MFIIISWIYVWPTISNDQLPTHDQLSDIIDQDIETEPRYNDYAVAVKTGAETVFERVPTQLLTFLRGIKNYYILAESAGLRIGDEEVVDVYTGAYKDATRRITHRQAQRIMPRRVDDMDHQPDHNRQGWKLDAHKFLSGYRQLYLKFPDAKWYIMIDDDSYVFMENLHYYLQKLDPSKPYYIGSPTSFVGCDGVNNFGDGPEFAHGGSVIVISAGAMTEMIKNVDNCIIRYKDCWAGDIRVALCLRDSGILLNKSTYNGHPPNYRDHHYGNAPCRQPISFHHLRPEAMQKLWNIERQVQTSVEGFHSTFYYTPVHLEDIWHTFVDKNDDVPDFDLNFARNGRIVRTIKAENWQMCREMCKEEAYCQSWSWTDSKCHLLSDVGRSEKKHDHVSGIVKGRFKCSQRTVYPF
ncbi:hypothetical protein BKA69DRAFT_1028188 [Paraphysoderma sedebokerense]|nr:hypothetical protein BKA69DRAFT_1028188 [Paraphysoderma sedebokerense]